MNKKTSIVPGSITAIGQQENKNIATVLMDVDVVIIADVSTSMETRDSRDGKTRYKILCDELAILQNDNPGKLLVIAFADKAKIFPGGIPPKPQSESVGFATDLAHALKYAKDFVNAPRRQAIVISDGAPNDEQAALTVAQTYTAPISCVYVGPTDGFGASGKAFLERLTAASGGQSATADRVMELAQVVKPMLMSGNGGHQ